MSLVTILNISLYFVRVQSEIFALRVSIGIQIRIQKIKKEHSNKQVCLPILTVCVLCATNRFCRHAIVSTMIQRCHIKSNQKLMDTLPMAALGLMTAMKPRKPTRAPLPSRLVLMRSAMSTANSTIIVILLTLKHATNLMKSMRFGLTQSFPRTNTSKMIHTTFRGPVIPTQTR